MDKVEAPGAGKEQVGFTVKCAPKEWPLFSAPGLSSLRVVNCRNKGGTLYFTVMAILEGFKWKIDRTYDEFAELQRTLTKVYHMEHPPLPSFKKLFSFFGSVKESEVEEMRKKLEAFTMSAVTKFPVPPMELLKFVEYPFTDVLSVTQALARFFYIEGEIVLANNKAVQMSPLQLHCINKRMTLPLASSESGKMKDDFGHLLDFLQNLRKLKITPPTEEHAIANVDTMTFDLNQMKSLEVLLVESINIHQLEARFSLPKQLVKLEVRRSLKFLQEILVVYPQLEVDCSPVGPAMPPLFSSTQAMDLSRAMTWEKLQQANFKLNGIKKIDESVKLLSALERLDLSYNYIEEVEHLVDLPHLRVLDLSHNKITCLNNLHTKLGNITKLALSSNNIVKLNGIQKMFSIQYLDLSNNQISDPMEVKYLDPLPCLEKLLLKGNPLTTSLSYRSQVFSCLPNFAEQVALDGKLPSKDELVISISTPTSGHKRVPSRTPDIKPDEEEVPPVPEVLEDLEVGMSKTSRLEELRKEGGDKWLSILNAEKQKEMEGSLVAPKSPKKKRTRHSSKSKSKKTHETVPEPEVSEVVLSSHLTELMESMTEEKLISTVNFNVTVLEYQNASFLSLSPADLDQVLNVPLEECVLSINTLIGKALEVDLTSHTTRITRELKSIHRLKVHEGKRLAVCLQLSSGRSSSHGGSHWVIYCVQDLKELAWLHHTLKTAMARSRSVTPERPLIEVITSIQAEVGSISNSLTDSGSQHRGSPSPHRGRPISNSLTDSRSQHRSSPSPHRGRQTDIGPSANSLTDSGSQHRGSPSPHRGRQTDIGPSTNSLTDSGSQHRGSPSPHRGRQTDIGPSANSITDSGSQHRGSPSPHRSRQTDIGPSLNSLTDSGSQHRGSPSPHRGSPPSDTIPTSIDTKPLQSDENDNSNSTISLVSDHYTAEGDAIVENFTSVSLEEFDSETKSAGKENGVDSRGHVHQTSDVSSTTGSDFLSCKNSIDTPVDSLSPIITPSVFSPEHNQSPDTLKKAETKDLQSRSPAETTKHFGDNSEMIAVPKSSLKLSSNSPSHVGSGKNTPKNSSKPSSRVGSGRNTPKTQRPGVTAASSSNSLKGGSSSSSLQGTPPLQKSAGPLHDLPSKYIADRLESLESPNVSLPSPLYSQESESKIVGGVEEEYDGFSKEDDKKEDSCTSLDIIKNAVDLSDPNSLDSFVGRRRERHSSRVIITKPGLDDNNLRLFFKSIIADESSEVFMSITWGISNLPSAPSCEIESAVIISDKGIYLLEVLDPEKHQSRPLSWTTQNFPLAKIVCCYHSKLRKINIGIFDQSLTVESFENGVVKRFVFFPHTYDKLTMFVENLKAVFDSLNLRYAVISSLEDSFVDTSSGKGIILQNPGSVDMAELKDSLVWSQSRAQVGNFIAVNSKSETNPLTISFDTELRRVSSHTTAKFDLIQYVIVGEICTDTLPISNGKLHVQSRALILTNKAIYLCKEELDSWPHMSNSIRAPPFPKCMVIDAHPISRISGIKVCDKAHPIISCTDPLYEFSILFEELDDIQLSPTLSMEWLLCVHDKQYLNQLLACLESLTNDLQKGNQKMVSVKHTSSRLTIPSSPKPPKTSNHNTTHSKKTWVHSNRGNNPCFFSSQVLFEFSVLTNYQRLKFFKRRIAQADFMKSDEIPLSIFLAHCSFSTSSSEYVEVETCVITSNYAVYLLSDIDNIQQWLDGGGVTSFQRAGLLDPKNSNQVRCFYRLWLREIKQVDVGVFYASIAVTVKESDTPLFTIHTENPSASVSFLSALSCVVELHDTVEEKEMDNLLSDYDLVIDTVKTDTKKEVKDKQQRVEFMYHSEDSIYKLKKAMVNISPAIKKGMPRDTCYDTLQILYQQVMLLVEELRIRDFLTLRYCPHLVFLTNYGIYVCLNEAGERCSPSIMDPSKLTVKKWCHIDLVERLYVASPLTSQYSCYNIIIYLRSIHRASLSSEDSNSLSLLVQNSELLNCFLYHFSLMYRERCGKQISVTRD